MMARSKVKPSSPSEPRFMKHLIFGRDVDEYGRSCLVVLRACPTGSGVMTVLERIVLSRGFEQN